MSRGEDDQAAPTLAYAQGPDGLQSAVPPIALLLPNFAAIVVLFLPISGNDPPIEPIVSYARHLMGNGGRSNIWEAFITGPFLLAIPLALWTIRLSIHPRARRLESIAAWSMAGSALAMTLLACGYALALSGKTRGFIAAVAAAMAILIAGAIALWTLRHFLLAYPPALLAMTAVYAANTTLTVLVVRTHSPWQVGSWMGTIVVIGQIGASAYLVFRWREKAS
jgi:hypothetical protein